MAKWVPDPRKAASDRVTRLLAEQKAAAERQAAREAAEAADRARRAKPTCRADKKALRR